MQTIHAMHAELSRAYQRTTAALDTLAQQIEALPGQAAKVPPAPKPRSKGKPKPAPKPQAEPSRNGVRVDIVGAGF